MMYSVCFRYAFQNCSHEVKAAGSPVSGPSRRIFEALPVMMSITGCMSLPPVSASSTAFRRLMLLSTVPERSFPCMVFSRQPTGA